MPESPLLKTPSLRLTEEDRTWSILITAYDDITMLQYYENDGNQEKLLSEFSIPEFCTEQVGRSLIELARSRKEK